MPESSKNVLLQASHLVKEFPVEGGKKGAAVHAVSDVSLTLFEGETLALVGESGCGKSTLGRLLIRLLPPTSGTVTYDGTDILALKERDFAPYRRQMQIIFQDPYASLDPRMNVTQIIEEPLRANGVGKTKAERQEKVFELMDLVGIPREYAKRYPHQFSGGQRQRIGIARAIALNPKLVVCDEPVSALDVSIQAQVLNLLRDLQQQKHMTYLFISHDLSVVRHISDRVAVMFLGKICEVGPTKDLYEHPLHPYTKFLLASVPNPDPTKRDENEVLLTGDIPSPVNPPSGCRFRTRCPFADAKCAEEEPAMQEVGERRFACHHPLT